MFSYEPGGMVEGYLELRWRRHGLRRAFWLLPGLALLSWSVASHLRASDLSIPGLMAAFILAQVALTLYLQGTLASLVRSRVMEEILVSTLNPAALVDTLTLHTARKFTQLLLTGFLAVTLGVLAAEPNISISVYVLALCLAPIWMVATAYAALFSFQSARSRLIHMAFLAPSALAVVASWSCPLLLFPVVLATLVVRAVCVMRVDRRSEPGPRTYALSEHTFWKPWNDHALVYRENLREGRYQRGDMSAGARKLMRIVPVLLIFPAQLLTMQLAAVSQGARSLPTLATLWIGGLLAYTALLWVLCGWRSVQLVAGEKEGNTWEIVLSTRLSPNELVQDWLTASLAGMRGWFFSPPMVLLPLAYLVPVQFLWCQGAPWPAVAWTGIALLGAWLAGRLGALVGIWSALSTESTGAARARFVLQTAVCLVLGGLVTAVGALIGAAQCWAGCSGLTPEWDPWTLVQLFPGLFLLMALLVGNLAYGRGCLEAWDGAPGRPSRALVAAILLPGAVDVLMQHGGAWGAAWLLAVSLAAVWFEYPLRALAPRLGPWSASLVGAVGSCLVYHCLWLNRVIWLYSGQLGDATSPPSLAHQMAPGIVMALGWWLWRRHRACPARPVAVRPVLAWLLLSLVGLTVTCAAIRLSFRYSAPAGQESDPDYLTARSLPARPDIRLPHELSSLACQTGSWFTDREFQCLDRYTGWIDEQIRIGQGPILAPKLVPLLQRMVWQGEEERRRSLAYRNLLISLTVLKKQCGLLGAFEQNLPLPEVKAVQARLSRLDLSRERWNVDLYRQAILRTTWLESPDDWIPAWWLDAQRNAIFSVAYRAAHQSALTAQNSQVPRAFWLANRAMPEPASLDDLVLLQRILGATSGERIQLPSGALATIEGDRYWRIVAGRRQCVWPPSRQTGRQWTYTTAKVNSVSCNARD